MEGDSDFMKQEKNDFYFKHVLLLFINRDAFVFFCFFCCFFFYDCMPTKRSNTLLNPIRPTSAFCLNL
jgi:heme/copper-type cytochrome/quinol oxidase subunit 3